MASRPFRFVQASDFHLHQPPHGLADIPDHLAEVLIEAPYRAAAGVFDAALAEEADFVLLVGNLLDPQQAGPRGVIFLGEQFARLAQRGIAVYWATGAIDRPAARSGDWFAAMRWPANVHLLFADKSTGQFDRRIHSRGEEPICQIVNIYGGLLASADSVARSGELFSLAVSPSADDFNKPNSNSEIARTDGRIACDYWAFGGSTDAVTQRLGPEARSIAHCAGSPQGRAPSETGPHGCTVVRVGAGREIQFSPIATDSVRWHQERIVLEPNLQKPDLERLLHQRMQSLIATAPDRTHLIRWTLTGANSLIARARHGDSLGGLHSGLPAEWLARLRAEYGLRTPAAWSISLEVESPAALPEAWYQQQTLLGDYLRAIRTLETPGAEGPNLEPLCPAAWIGRGLDLCRFPTPTPTPQPLTPNLDFRRFDGPAARSAVLRQAAIVGAELLRPDPLDPEEPSP